MSSSERKKERRRARYERNVKKEQDHKEKAWNEGKLIEENHNQGPYSEAYTLALCERLCQYVRNEEESATDPEDSIRRFRKYKMKIQDLILHWNPAVTKGEGYEWLKEKLESYWDNYGK